jgi:hypothetical protein
MPGANNFDIPAVYATDLETWQNQARGGTGIMKYDRYGNPTGERIPPGGKTTVTPRERRLNQDRAATDELDPFKNGRLIPIRLLDSEPDTAALKANPNGMSDTEIDKLFTLSTQEMSDRLDSVSNPLVLERAKAKAEERDATIRQVKVIDDHLEKLAPKPKRVKTFKDVRAEIGEESLPPEMKGGGVRLTDL